MDLDEGQDQVAETEEVEEIGHSQEAEQESPEYEGGYNPVFEPIRQKLGLNFESIKDDLQKIDKDFNSGITKANSRYTPWKQFEEKGITPDTVSQAFTALQSMQDDPQGLYERLGEFLKQNGRLPETQAEVAEALSDDDDLTDEQRQLSELQKQFEEQQQFMQAQFEQQEMARIQEKVDKDVSDEYASFEAAHPNLSADDKKWIYQQHYNYAASGPQNIKSLEQVFGEYESLVNRIRTAPRPNDSAPRLPGAGGGVPTGERKNVAEFSREESQNMLASLLEQSKKN